MGDGLDPSVAPGVSHHEPGGLTVRDLLNVLQAQRAPLVGADIVELNPYRDINGMTATVAAKLVREFRGHTNIMWRGAFSADGRYVFTTSQDFQDAVRARVCQGESRKLSENQELGMVELNGLTPTPRGKTRNVRDRTAMRTHPG